MASGTVSDPQGRSWPAASNSCSDVRAAFTQAHVQLGYPSYSAVSCSADPVKAGTVVTFSPSGQWTVSAITATAAPTGGTSDTGGTGGTGTSSGSVSTGTGTLTVTVKVEPAQASPERINDLMQLFYLSIAFLVVIYGGKKLLNLFDRDHEKD